MADLQQHFFYIFHYHKHNDIWDIIGEYSTGKCSSLPWRYNANTWIEALDPKFEEKTFLGDSVLVFLFWAFAYNFL